MDRIDAMKVFVTAVDEGSLAGAARQLRRSPTAVSRAIALLEEHVGAELLHRTTRSIRLSEAGERYVGACRRILADLEEAELAAGGARAAARGTLHLSAPSIAGETVLRPVVDDFLQAYPLVSARMLLLDRQVNLVDEGIDLALRVGQLRDSSLIATRVGGDVRRVVVAAPRYLAEHPPIREVGDLAGHRIIAYTGFSSENWSFAPAPGSTVPRIFHFTPRLEVSSLRASLESAAAGLGIARAYSYHVAEHVHRGELRIILAEAEPDPMPVHLLMPPNRATLPKVRAFVDFAAPRLRAEFARLAVDARELG
jgi:DNA-binding transcriptional LysR family regulator